MISMYVRMSLLRMIPILNARFCYHVFVFTVIAPPLCVALQVREERFRTTSESTNVRVLWWSLGQTVVLLVIGVWQMRHLKSFFEAKKIV